MAEGKRCRKCNEFVWLGEFSSNKRAKDDLQYYCRSCNNSYSATPEYLTIRRGKQQDTRLKVDAVKLAAGCVDCGYKAYAAALDFDHRPDEVKSFNISQSRWKSWPDLESEMAKCDVRCANCHRVMTARRAGWVM